MGTAIAKVMKQVSPREHQLFLGVPFYLFGYKRGCWVTAIDPRLQNLEFGYSYLAVTADCIHKCVIFHKNRCFRLKAAVFSNYYCIFCRTIAIKYLVHGLDLRICFSLFTASQNLII